MATPVPAVRGARLAAAGGGLGAVALAVVLLGLTLTGAAGASLVADPGAATRWGLPLAKVVDDVAACLTVGLLVLAAVALPLGGAGRRTAGSRSPELAGTALTVVRLAGATAFVWAVSGAVVLVLSYARLAGVGPGEPGFSQQLGQFITEIDLLRALLVSSLVVAVVATGAVVATRQVTVGWMALLSVVALLPVALTGHASGSLDHELAVDSLAMHLVGVTVWVGGLVGLVVLRGRLGPALPDVVARYSTLALWCFGLVALSGAVNAWLRLGGLDGLQTRYGALVGVKVASLVLLGVAGAAHRRRTIRVIAAEPAAAQAFWRLAIGELVVMGVAVGAAVALASSAPPREVEAAGTPALALTGYPMPPPLDLARWFGAWRVDLLWTTVAVLLAGLYVVGVRRLAARGDRWPVLRTVAWVAGCVVLVWATSGAPGIYGRVLFSAHMMGHMTMSMVVPPLLVLGAPVTLALRTLPARRDGSQGPREWLLAVVHSRFLALVGHPLVAAGLFAGSLIAFYYSPLFELSLRTHTGHVLMHVHFLLVGYLFASVLIGVDPGPRHPPYPMRLLLLFATMAFHAFFGIALVQGSQLLAPDVLGALGRTWGRSPIADQQYGGAVAWGVGELPVLLLGMGIAIAWVRSDDREARRSDRQADRDGDAELAAYNARLARMRDEEVRR
ncbi:cytochrome c oxidase assembly protein [Angustibacter peucedani]